MATPSSLTLNYDAILSTTLFKYQKTLEDQISTANAFFFYLMKKERDGYQTLSDIGDRMAMPLMYELGSADSYSGYNVLDTTPMDGITTAFYNWRQAAVPITISGLEEKKNAGEERIIALLESKTKQAEIGLQTFFNQKLLQGSGTDITAAYTSAANGSVFIDPLGLSVMFDPTSAVTVGNIPQATYSWWQNKTKTSAATTYAGFLKELRSARNNASKGPGGPPNLHLADQATVEYYEAALAAAHRNPSYQVADIPFDNIAFYGKPVVWDEYVPNSYTGTSTQVAAQGSWYMLNTQFWGIRVHKDTNFSSTPFIKPENQDAKTAHLLWLGAIGVSNRRKQGVLAKIDTTVVA